MIASRYLDIRDELGLDLALEPELEALKKRIDAKEVTQEELVSRGEYFSAKLMAALPGLPVRGRGRLGNVQHGRHREPGGVLQGAAQSGAAWLRRGDPRILRRHARRRHPHLLPGRQRHHRRTGCGGAGRGRVRKLDGCIRHPHGRPPGSWTILRLSRKSPTTSFGS